MSNLPASGPTPPTDEQHEMLTVWRAMALKKMPYFASILFAVRPLDAPGLGTFAVDKGWRLYIDFAAVAGWGDNTCAEVLLHECGHLWADHAGDAERLGITVNGQPTDPRKSEIWNVAGDCALNDDLVDAGCQGLVDVGAMLPGRFNLPEWQTPEFYYRNLLQQQSQVPQGGSCGSGSGGQSAGCELPTEGPGSDPGSEGGGSGQGDGSDEDGAAASPYAPASPVEQERHRVAAAASMKEHVAKGRGTVPAGLMERAERLLAPSKVPWQQVLGSTIRRSLASKMGQVDVTHTRRSRRHHSETIRQGATQAAGSKPKRAIRPGYFAPAPIVAVVRDTSGSMSSHDLAVVTREVEGIAKKVGVRGDALTVTDVDAAVHGTKRFTNAASISEVQGRGGTDMVVGIEAVANPRRAGIRAPKPTVVVVLTDGETPWPTQPVGVPVVAAIIAGGDYGQRLAEGTPDWMKTVVIDPADIED